jgi:hypothetical protein
MLRPPKTQRNRYSNSERVFRADARFDADAPGAGAGGAASQALSLTHQLDSDHSLQDLLLFYAAEKEPRAFVEGFDALVAFVDASLDLYKVRGVCCASRVWMCMRAGGV